MKKRSQKLSLHRETLAHLDILAGRKLVQVAGGYQTSCGYECGCQDEFATQGTIVGTVVTE
jgi:hypothetical protein